jgi:hypothetical protein
MKRTLLQWLGLGLSHECLRISQINKQPDYNFFSAPVAFYNLKPYIPVVDN